ncbi:hypothetical protein EDM59_05670 [Brevibacillus nitrificans]|uniref:Uncharacterized protein n=1 Tax=Brevibacillus nitrificans TaxID=651560 RepID=A0A3M8DKP1_9BACL|nr:hypothetical protein EDM59_05670 [Brevibacillus nitrificans]
MDEVIRVDRIIIGIAFYLNPFIAIWFFVNFTTIIRKIVNSEDYDSNLWIGSLLLAWLVFSFTNLSMSS